MNEMMKNVKIIFKDLPCPPILMPSVIYNTKLVDEFLEKNGDEDIKFDDFVDYIRRIPTSVGVICCSSFLTWWSNNATSRYYWPMCGMTIDIDRGYYYDIVTIGGLMKYKCTTVNYNSYRNPVGSIFMQAIHIKDVIFNDPATIVFWSDGTKTVCTCSEQDVYDPEKGLALCVMKKMLYNNKGHIFNNAREKWLKKGEKKR